MLNVYDVIRLTGFFDAVGDEEQINEFVNKLKEDKSLQFVIRKQFLKWAKDNWGYVSNIYSSDHDGQEWHFIIKRGTITTNDVFYDNDDDAEEACIISLCLRSNIDYK
jgi:hypothetical protein